MNRYRHITQVAVHACVWSAVALLAACASGVNLNNEVPVETRNLTDRAAGTSKLDGNAAGNNGVGESAVALVDLSKAGKGIDVVNPGMGRIVYFDFDSFAIKDEYRAVLEGNAKLLNANKPKRMTIEGHTDERGGREYNLALGQKRAEAVQRALALLGVTDTQVEAVSYGEERPAAQGSDEAAWAKNRRAELKDR